MIYRQRNKKKTFKILFIFILILIVLRIFNNPIVVRLFEYPVLYVLDSQTILLSPVKQSLIYFKNKKELQEEIDTLKKENLELRISQLFDQSNLQEFDYFKSQFGTQEEIDTLFRVIQVPPFSPFDIIKITGDLKTYQVGDFVLYKNILIGKIIEKNNAYASISLFSSPETRVPVLIKGSQFEALGLGGGRYVFEVARDFQIEEGDIILYPDQNPYILGSVGLIEASGEELFKKIYFNVPVALRSLSYVSLIQKESYEKN